MVVLFYLKKMKIEKVKKLVPNLYDNNEYVIHIKKIKASIQS